MKTFVAIPCMDQMQTKFVQSLVSMERVGSMSFNFSESSLVYYSRNELASMAIKEKSDYILWLDSDMIFPRTLLLDLMDAIKGRDFVSGIYYRRRPPFGPVLYKTIKMGILPEENVSESYDEIPDGIFEIAAAGFGCVLMKTELMETVFQKYQRGFDPLPGYGEDISLCIRAKNCGYKLHAASHIRLGHVAQTIVTQEVYNAWKGSQNAK